MDKQEIRNKHLEKRAALTKCEIKKRSNVIAERLFATGEFRNAKTIMCFVSISKEPETRGIIKKAWREKKRVCVPLTDFSKNEMIAVEIKDFSDIMEKKSGLLEPKDSKKKVKKEEIDLVIAPGLAFDRQGNRIGRGKGFFDRFLCGFGAKLPAVGICFEENLENCLPMESHDAKMLAVITEKQTIKCK